jgi:hypothetical protein
MINKISRAVMAAILFLLFAGSLPGCMPGPGSPAGKPPRKKMLSLDAQGDGMEAYQLTSPAPGEGVLATKLYPPLPFALADTTIAFGGDNADFYVLRIPSAQFDFLLPMVKTYEPWLSAWLSAWPQMGRRGVAIDLSAGKATRRAIYQVESAAQHVSIPLVVLWDNASADRVTYLTNFMQSLSTVHCESVQ